MKYQKIFLLLVMVMALTTITLSAALTEEEAYFEDDDADEAKAEAFEASVPQEEKAASLGRFLAQRPTLGTTCNKDPRICRAHGSPGPHCCKKKCVNLSTDRLNCGKCGKKCKYYQICCKGKCVNPLSDKKHCGGCNNKCRKGNRCVYGMCNYA